MESLDFAIKALRLQGNENMSQVRHQFELLKEKLNPKRYEKSVLKPIAEKKFNELETAFEIIKNHLNTTTSERYILFNIPRNDLNNFVYTTGAADPCCLECCCRSCETSPMSCNCSNIGCNSCDTGPGCSSLSCDCNSSSCSGSGCSNLSCNC